METILKNSDFINQVFAWQKPPDRSAKDAISAYRSRPTVEVMKQMFLKSLQHSQVPFSSQFQEQDLT